MPETPSLSVVIPALNAADTLPRCLAAVTVWPGEQEVFVVDGGSADETVTVAHAFDVTVLPAERGRGLQLRRGGLAATKDWLLFLHADTELAPEWTDAALAFMGDPVSKERVAAFRFVLDDNSEQARRVERGVAWRCRNLGLPYGDQGLLIHRDHYEALGGYTPLPLMEDVDLIRRAGHSTVRILDAAATTSAERYRRDGWWARPSRNLFCLFLYYCGLPPRWIARLYA